MLVITRTNSFEAAHFLPKVHEKHKCRRVHGHSYELRAEIKGTVDDKGWILDTAQLDSIFTTIHKQLDHQTLNEVEGLENPTTENLAVWCWTRFNKCLGDNPRVDGIAITIRESPRSTAYYDGP